MGNVDVTKLEDELMWDLS